MWVPCPPVWSLTWLKQFVGFSYSWYSIMSLRATRLMWLFSEALRSKREQGCWRWGPEICCGNKSFRKFHRLRRLVSYIRLCFKFLQYACTAWYLQRLLGTLCRLIYHRTCVCVNWCEGSKIVLCLNKESWIRMLWSSGVRVFMGDTFTSLPLSCLVNKVWQPSLVGLNKTNTCLAVVLY